MSRILRILRGEHLPCGCTAGVYETYDGGTLRVLDVRADMCRNGQHRPGIVLAQHDARAGGADRTGGRRRRAEAPPPAP